MPAAKGAYAKAGVDLAKVRGIQRSLATTLSATFRNRTEGAGTPLIAIGHYAGLVELGGGRALALHADGVGTKVLVAQALGKYDTVGIDAVAMTVNDLVCVGAEPIALLDYLALEREDESLVKELMKGLVVGAGRAGAPVVGGETAVMGDVLKGVGGHGFDLACLGAGVVDKDRVVDGSSITAGDAILGFPSSGLHSNGYTLARKVLLRRHRLDEFVPALDKTLGEEILTPTEIYVRPVLKLLRKVEVHGIAHVTGGAYGKLMRLAGRRKVAFRLEPQEAPPIFRMIREEARLSTKEMYSTFNMGTGLCAILPASELEEAVRICRKEGVAAGPVGSVGTGRGVYVAREKLA